MNHMSATVNETALAIVMTSGEAFPSNETLARGYGDMISIVLISLGFRLRSASARLQLSLQLVFRLLDESYP